MILKRCDLGCLAHVYYPIAGEASGEAAVVDPQRDVDGDGFRGGPWFDVAIVGGGPAGLAAAPVLGRMRRKVVLFDADDPAHAASEGVHGFFGHDGIPPLDLRRLGA